MEDENENQRNASPDGKSRFPIAPEEAERLRAVLQQAVARVCPSWLASQREDIVQAAFVRVFRTLQKEGEEREPPGAPYLWRAAYNATMDEIRRLRRRPESPLEDHVAESATETANDPGVQHDAAETRRAIGEGLRRLRPDRRRAVQLQLYGFTLEESARLLGWTTKRVDNQRYLGMAELRRHLTRRGFEP